MMNKPFQLTNVNEEPLPILEGNYSSKNNSFMLMIWRNRGYLLLVLDVVTIITMFMLSYFLRFHLEWFVIKSVPVAHVWIYLNGAVLLAFLWVFLIWRTGAYENGLRGIHSPMARLRSLFSSGIYALGLMMVISFMLQGLFISRQVYLMTAVLAGSTMVLIQLLFRAIDQDLAEHGIITHEILVVGLGKQSQEFANRIQDVGGAVRVIGFIRWRSGEEKEVGKINFPILGELDKLKSIFANHPFDTLVLSASTWSTLQEEHKNMVITVLNFCEAQNISLYILPEAFNVAITQREIGSLSGVPLIQLKDASLHPAYAIAKRCMDISISLLGLILGMPIWILIAVLIKFVSKGPIFFIQTRIGIHGKPFKIFKFRTMVVDAEERLSDLIDLNELDVPGFKIQSDPRVTSVGRFLRRFSLDEFPQLLNVLLGEMSLVGPRPEMPELVEKYTPEHRRRLKAKPGLTGYQQVEARGQPLAACRKYDLIYLKYQSLLFDSYILFRTVIVILRGSGITH